MQWNEHCLSQPYAPCSTTNSNSFEWVMCQVQSSNFTAAEKDLFWHYYVTYYMGLKQKLQHSFLNMHAYRQGFYNDCIGNNNSEKINRISAVIRRYVTQAQQVWHWIHGSSIPGETLHTENGNLLKDKEKRFLPYDESYDSDKTEAEIGEDLMGQAQSAYLQGTGNCPIINDLSIFLGGIFKDQSMLTVVNGSNTAPVNFYGGYLTPILFKALALPATPVMPPASLNFQGIVSLSSGNKQLSLKLADGASAFTPPVMLTIPSTQVLTWSGYGTNWSIIQVSELSHTGNSGGVYNFSFVAKVMTIGGSPQFFEMVITGTTSAVLTCSNDPGIADAIGGVYVPPADPTCTKKQDFAQALLQLIQNLQATSHVNDSNYDLLTNTTYVNGYLPDFLMVNNGVLTQVWKHSGTNTYIIGTEAMANSSSPRESIVLNLNLSTPIVSLYLVGLNSAGTAHVVNAVDDQGTLITGEVNTNSWVGGGHSSLYVPLEFRCCKPRTAEVDDRTPQDFLNAIKAVANEVLLDAEIKYTSCGISCVGGYMPVSANWINLASFFINPVTYFGSFTYGVNELTRVSILLDLASELAARLVISTLL
ncbi:hypothetical protein [Flavobacterium sp. 3HN19-14]|uniref:hypothetical protein n=1 Tax=Flavobacterium sp. 3HN19-14 TaxID=3448133 RepID=UPI003EE18A57